MKQLMRHRIASLFARADETFSGTYSVNPNSSESIRVQAEFLVPFSPLLHVT